MQKVKTRMTEDGRLVFWCPGCKEPHGVPVRQAVPGWSCVWTWNGSRELPTLAPSVLIRSGHYVPGYASGVCWCTYNREHPNDPAPFVCGVCHTFVRDGRIQFLNDCTHEYAGRTVELEAF